MGKKSVGKRRRPGEGKVSAKISRWKRVLISDRFCAVATEVAPRAPIEPEKTKAKAVGLCASADEARRLVEMRFGAPGPSEVLSISLPGNIKAAVQEAAGKQGVSALVSRAITNELALLARADLVAWIEGESGPITAAERDEARALLAE